MAISLGWKKKKTNIYVSVFLKQYMAYVKHFNGHIIEENQCTVVLRDVQGQGAWVLPLCTA